MGEKGLARKMYQTGAVVGLCLLLSGCSSIRGKERVEYHVNRNWSTCQTNIFTIPQETSEKIKS